MTTTEAAPRDALERAFAIGFAAGQNGSYEAGLRRLHATLSRLSPASSPVGEVERVSAIIRNWRAGNAGEDDATDTARLILATLSPLSGEPAPSGTVACTEVLEAIKAALGDCELNPANYDHEDVSYLNQCNISAWMLANEALAALASAGRCAPSVPVAFLYQTDTEEWLSRRDDDTPKAECDFKVIPLYSALSKPTPVEAGLREALADYATFAGEVAGTSLGLAMSTDHPSPDTALMGMFEKSQALVEKHRSILAALSETPPPPAQEGGDGHD